MKRAGLSPLALTPDQQREIRCILRAVAPWACVWVFGSRATGKARPFSDLDLLLDCHQPLDWEQRAALQDAFEKSDLPFKVDLVESRNLPAGFLRRVEQEKVRL